VLVGSIGSGTEVRCLRGEGHEKGVCRGSSPYVSFYTAPISCKHSIPNDKRTNSSLSLTV